MAIAAGASAGIPGGVIAGLVMLLIHRNSGSALITIEANVRTWVLALSALGFCLGLDLSPPAAGPRQVVNQGFVYAISVMAGGAFFGGIWLGEADAELARVGALCGLIVGIAVMAGSSPWLFYLVSCLLLAARGPGRRLPVRPARFLDWAHEAGLVRLAGVAVQFRHLEFQDWLISQHRPSGQPVGR